jgi:hypothetical protein
MGVRDFGKVTGARKSAGYNVVSSLQNEAPTKFGQLAKGTWTPWQIGNADETRRCARERRGLL